MFCAQYYCDYLLFPARWFWLHGSPSVPVKLENRSNVRNDKNEYTHGQLFHWSSQDKSLFWLVLFSCACFVQPKVQNNTKKDIAGNPHIWEAWSFLFIIPYFHSVFYVPGPVKHFVTFILKGATQITLHVVGKQWRNNKSCSTYVNRKLSSLLSDSHSALSAAAFDPLNKGQKPFSPSSSVNVPMACLNAQRRGSMYVGGVSVSSLLSVEVII